MKRITAIILAAVMLLVVMPFGAYAANWGEGDTLDDALSQLKVGFDDTNLDWLVLPGIGVVYQRYTYFLYKNERIGTVDEHPVYCIDPTKGGAYDYVQNIGYNSDGSRTATYIRGNDPASEINPAFFEPPALNAYALLPNDGVYIAYAEVYGDWYQRYLVESDPKIEVTASFLSRIDNAGTPPPDEPGLRIRKVQTGTSIPLVGAVFEVRDPEGRLIYSLATPDNGIIDIPLTVEGNYLQRVRHRR